MPQIDSDKEKTYAATHFSLRKIAGLEVTSVVGSVLLTAWGLVPLQLQPRWIEAIPGLLALALMIYSHWIHGESPRVLGFTTSYFGRTVKLLFLPTLVASLLLIGTGYLAGSLNFGERFWLSLLLLPWWGLLQQYILQGFIYRRLQFIFGAQKKMLPIFLAALLFALIHAPNGPLMLLTFVGGFIWTWVYARAPNLWVLGFSHALMSALAMYSLPAWVLPSMGIGYKYLLYQRF